VLEGKFQVQRSLGYLGVIIELALECEDGVWELFIDEVKPADIAPAERTLALVLDARAVPLRDGCHPL
jgi:hypothetical protein